MKKGLGILLIGILFASCSKDEKQLNAYPQLEVTTTVKNTYTDYTNDGIENFIQSKPYDVKESYKWECNINASGKIKSTNSASSYNEYFIDSYANGLYSTHNSENVHYDFSFGVDKVDVEQKVPEGILNIIYTKN